MIFAFPNEVGSATSEEEEVAMLKEYSERLFMMIYLLRCDSLTNPLSIPCYVLLKMGEPTLHDHIGALFFLSLSEQKNQWCMSIDIILFFNWYLSLMLSLPHFLFDDLHDEIANITKLYLRNKPFAEFKLLDFCVSETIGKYLAGDWYI